MQPPSLEELTPDMVGDFMQQASTERRESLRQSILAAANTNPDQYAEATKLGRAAGVPPAFVENELDTYRNTMKMDDMTADRIVSLFPDYAAWLQEDDNAKLAHDDVGALLGTLDLMRSLGASVVDDFAGRTIQGVGGQLSAVANIAAEGEVLMRQAEQEGKLWRIPVISGMNDLASTAAIGVASMAGSTLEYVGKKVRSVGDLIAPPVERRGFKDDFARGLGQGASTIATAWISRPLAIISTLAQGSSAQMDEIEMAQKRGRDVDPDGTMESLGVLTGGIVTAATEMPVYDMILKRFPAADKIFKAVPDKYRNDAVEFVGKMVMAGGAEGIQEAAEGFLQRLITQGFIDPEREDYSLGEAGEDATLGAAVGATLQGLVLAALHITDRRVPQAVQEQVEREFQKQKTIETINAIRATKTNARDAEKMREVLKAGNPDGKVVTLDATVVRQFYQSGIDPEQFYQLAPSAREQFEQAEVAGTDISIPLDEFLHAVANVPDSAYDFMTDFMKVDPTVDPAVQGWDMADPAERDAFIQQAVRQAQEEWGAQYEQTQEAALDERIERQIRDNLMNPAVMGEKVRTPEAAATEATLYGSFARTLIRSGDEAATRVFERRFGTNFQVEGFRPPVRRVGTGKAYYDRLRSKVKARAAAEKRGQKKRAEKAGFFGTTPRKRTKATPTPLINALIARGGIQRGSPIAAELEHIGITPKSHPRLYARGKLRDIDNIVVSELEGDLGTSGVFTDDGNGYVDRNDLLDKLRDETFGNYIRSDEMLEQESIEEAEQQILDLLSEQGVDITTASAAEIDAAIDQATEQYRMEYETAQPGAFYQAERGVTQFADGGQTIIKLFEGADQSTLLHETGHVFLDIFADIASQPDAPQAIKDDFARTMEWLGVQSYDQVQTPQHEQFARGFEAYLYQGEAPSASLRATFDKFKLWLTNLYRSIKSLNVNVSPEMKGVFDRLLATNDEINAIRNNPVVGIEAQTLEMLTKPQREQYLKRKEEAIREAKNKLFRKAIRQARRQNTEWWNTEFARVQREVEAELQKMPVYQVTNFLQTGSDFEGVSMMVDDDGNTITPIKEQHQLNEELTIKAFDDASPTQKLGKEELKYLPRGTRTKQGGIDPKLISDMFGYKSAIEMLRDMQQAEPYAAAVHKQTEDRMIAQYGDMLNDGTIEQEALAMVMAEDTKAAQVELKALSQRTGVEYPSDGDFARAAEIALGTLTVDQAVKPDKYYRAALKAARDYGRALGKKDFEAAADAKRREIVNKHLHRLSKAARDETNKAIDKFKKLEKIPPKGDASKVKIDPEYHQKIWQILDKYNLAPRLSEAKRLNIELQAMNEWIMRKEQDEDAALVMPPELLAADTKTHYRDLTMNEFRGLRDLVENLETQGRNKRKFILEGQQRDLEQLAAELVATAEQYNEPRAVALSERRQNRKLKNKLGNVINGVDAVNTKASQMMALLDGGENFGLWTRTVYEPMQRAEINRNIRQRAEFKRFKDIMEEHYSDEGRGFLDREYQVGGESIRLEELLSIALHQGTEDNRAKLIDGYEEARGWNQDMIDDALSNMREKDWNFVQSVWDYMDSFWAETSAVEKRRFGYAPEKIEATPFEAKTADGKTVQLRGGYMRIMYDADQDVMTGNDELAQTFKELQIGKNARASTRRGAMIERVSGVRRPIRLDLDVITEHVGEQVGIITMSETVENISKVLRKKEVQEVLQNTIGRERKEMLDLWLKDVAVGGQMAGGSINRALRTIRSNYTVGRLGLKPMTALLQFSGIAHTWADLGAKQTFKGVAKVFSRGNPYTVAREVAEKSLFMQERRFTLNREIADALNEYSNKAGTVRSKVSAMMLYPMQKMQEIVDTATWLSAYDKATLEGMDDADAIRTADIAVARLQASGLTSDLAAIERGTLNTATQRQELVKATTMFFSYFNAKYNLLKNKNIQYKNKQISGVDLAMSYLMALLVEGTISAAIMGQIDWDNDDDEELSAGEIATGIVSTTLFNYASTIPFARTIASGAQGFSGEGAAMGQLSGLGEFAGRMVGTAEKLIEGDTDKINGYALTRQAVDALNTFIPLPASVINQFIRGLELEEKTGDASPIDYLVYREDRF
ncbi:MAG: hypothetical protein RBT70_08765 [Alphaproteobacteria bacterium]|jgi:hypothetical protein|nr:hypothetical protein [Alphaproteobacteria bacterium]